MGLRGQIRAVADVACRAAIQLQLRAQCFACYRLQLAASSAPASPLPQAHAHTCTMHAPLSHSGRDVLAVSVTGSGKTLSYLLPCLAQLMSGRPRPGTKNSASPDALVLVPTRELAEQASDNTWGREGQHRQQGTSDVRLPPPLCLPAV